MHERYKRGGKEKKRIRTHYTQHHLYTAAPCHSKPLPFTRTVRGDFFAQTFLEKRDFHRYIKIMRA